MKPAPTWTRTDGPTSPTRPPSTRDGNTYRLRGLRTQSGANGDTDVNERYGAVLLVLAIGEEPTDAMIAATRRVVAKHRRLFKRSRQVVGHGQIFPPRAHQLPRRARHPAHQRPRVRAQGRPQVNTRNTAIAAVVGIFAITLAAVVVLAIAVDDGARATSLIGLVLATLAPTIGVVVTVLKLGELDRKVDRSLDHTEALTNGLADAKMRAAVADVMRDDLIDPGAVEQVDADRVRRDTGIN